MLLWGVGLTAATETLSFFGLRLWLRHPGGLSEDTIRMICETSSMPPLPIFVLTVVGTALIAISLALMAGHYWHETRVTRALAATGQMALTWYLFHIAIGAAWVYKRGWHTAGTVANGILVGAIFFALIVVISSIWKRHFKYGPLEWVLRNVSN